MYCRLLASDCELAALPAAAAGEAELTLRLRTRAVMPHAAAHWYRTTEDEGSIVIDRASAQEFVVRFADGTSFLVGAGGGTIEVLAAPAQYTDGDLAEYALGPVLAIALHLRGAVLLHASSAVMRGRAVLFAGPSGSGKSATAATLHRFGYDVLSDDLTEINDAFEALPSVAAIRLWPDVLQALHGSANAFPTRAPSWDKKLVRVSAVQDARAIAAILFLEGHAPHASLERLGPREGWLRLIANAYTARLPDSLMSRRIFDVTSALADRVPLFAFKPPPMAELETVAAFLERELAEWLR